LTADVDVLPPDNLFTGTLPNSIGQWSRLNWFFAHIESHNPSAFFTGPLPDGIGQWTNLELISLLNHGLTGTLPDTIGQWTNLQFLNIG